MFFECDGLQHFQPISRFGGEERFKKQLDRDYRKNQIFKDKYNGCRLIRIYNEEIIHEKINIIFDSSTTIEMLAKNFKNIFVIENGQILLQKR